MDLTPGQVGALTRALDQVCAERKQFMLDYGTALWEGFGSWRDKDVSQFLDLLLPTMDANKRAVAQATDAYISTLMGTKRAGLVDLSQIRNGVDLREVYQRPATQMRYQLSQGSTVTDALHAGSVRLRSLISTDMQLSHTHQARYSMTRKGSGVEAFARVPTGTENCAICLIASTQRYWKGDLLPIHPGCDCKVRPLGKGEHPDQVIDQDLLDKTHDAVLEGIGMASADGRTAADYRQLIIVTEHGEYGPVLNFKENLNNIAQIPTAKGSSTYRAAKITNGEEWGKIWSDNIAPTRADGRDDLGYIFTVQGWDGPIEQIDGEAFDAFVETSGHPAIYRGIKDADDVRAQEMLRQFVEDDSPWIGKGVYGDGWYSTTSLKTANQYAGKVSRFAPPEEGFSRAHIGEAVIEIAIRPEAKVVDFDQAPGGMGGRGTILDAEEGVDVVRRTLKDGEVHYIILNRSAVVVRRLP